MQYPEITSQIPQHKKQGFFRLEEIFIRAASKRMETQFMVLTESNLENFLYRDHLGILRPRNRNLEVILEYLLQSHKLLTLPLIQMNMISLWWDQMVFLTNLQTNKSYRSFGIFKERVLRQTRLKINHKKCPLSERQLQKW